MDGWGRVKEGAGVWLRGWEGTVGSGRKKYVRRKCWSGGRERSSLDPVEPLGLWLTGEVRCGGGWIESGPSSQAPGNFHADFRIRPPLHRGPANWVWGPGEGSRLQIISGSC